MFQDHIYTFDVITELRASHVKKELDPWPFVIFCGKTVKQLTCFHVVYDKYEYSFNSSTDAISFVYKLIFVVNIDLPLLSAHIWSFFIKTVFCMEKSKRIVAKPQINELSINLGRTIVNCVQ